jgi:hypothetical protein
MAAAALDDEYQLRSSTTGQMVLLVRHGLLFAESRILHQPTSRDIQDADQHARAEV